MADATRLQGREPSFNDLLDLDAAWRIAADFAAPTAVVVRHTDPVGIASDDALAGAFRRALETDPAASFGSIVGVNRPVDEATAREIAEGTFEARGRARLHRRGARGSCPRGRSSRSSSVPPNPSDGPARLRDRGARLQARRRRAARRDARRDDARPRPAARRDPAPPDARGADRPDVRLAGGRPRPLQRDRPRPEPPDGRDRRRPGEPPGRGGDRPAPGRRPGAGPR